MTDPTPAQPAAPAVSAAPPADDPAAHPHHDHTTHLAQAVEHEMHLAGDEAHALPEHQAAPDHVAHAAHDHQAAPPAADDSTAAATHEHHHVHEAAAEVTGGSTDPATRQLEAYRRQKDKWMQESPDSPLDHHQRHTFTGLNYFPVDAAYRVTATLDRDAKPHMIQIQTTTGEWREYNHFGVFHFALGGQPLTLNAYQPTGENAHKGDRELFVPFRDRTAPKETYGAGRYLEIRSQKGDDYILDFNRSANPWCAYSPNYSCTIPPPENHLPVEVRAGEKLFEEH